ncbi:MAG TPA: EAL domain-containing protein [Methylomusa anaerophila]|uniref:Cyclic di-GMP phosphodiesterase Gmr n=1 Tax=Methylomusa anaerophila TaxID=1930071 RepID=A0A348AK75_9FIRM|nr:EAL domain-containing protein [Methylomusa anaerophila]BBB91473.1 cyclic di-GMP phosphodiesterase Gmr [Methylomusa anaerophila]HML89938.1 EAL domain-containing protein [Methylomusa anaerophila]
MEAQTQKIITLEKELVLLQRLYQERLEDMVKERTAELKRINEQLEREIAVQKETEDKLRKYQILTQSTSDIMLFTHCDGSIVEANQAAVITYGYERDKLLTMNYSDLSRSCQVNLDMTQFAQGTFQLTRFESEHQRKDGSRFPVEVSCQSAVLGRERVLLYMIRDISERKILENELEYFATHDRLTKIPNRYTLEKKITELIAAAGDNSIGALMLIDLDNFKLVNDTYGHAVGDQVLVSLVTLLRKYLRPRDIIARLGSDEFAVFLEDVAEEECKGVAEKIRRLLDESELFVQVHHLSVNLTASIGIVAIDGSLDFQRVLAYADTAVYAAKDSGKNRVVVVHDELDKEKLSQVSQIAAQIKSALKEDRFVLYYQPVYRLGKGIIHYEALIRMYDEKGGLVPPGVFIPVAERFGMMSQIDRWIVRTVLNVIREHPGMTVFINLSGLSLGDKALLDYIETSIRDSGIEPSWLGFEITETTAVNDMSLAERWIKRLKGIGCRYAIDDFGVGFSSFSLLQALPVDYIKIDGSFVRNLNTNPTQRALVQAMQAAAKALGKKTIAEFVENEEIVGILRVLEVDYGQGFHLGKPLPLEELPWGEA